MRRAARGFLSLALAIAATGCGQPSQQEGPPPGASEPANPAEPSTVPLYEGTGLVLDASDRDPEFCLGGVNESLPPQCAGIPIVGWDWTEVDGEESAAGTTWGHFNLVGGYDGEVFTVHKAGPPKGPDSGDADRIGTPCPEPAGGWVATDPARASQEDVVDAQREASREPDFAGLWVDYYNEPPGGPTEEDPGDIILNVAFTGDLERHERELRELWGGPLCVTQHDHTLRELQKIQNTFPADEFELETLWSSLDVVTGVVEIGVVVVDEETRQRIDERYGEGLIQVEARLNPID